MMKRVLFAVLIFALLFSCSCKKPETEPEAKLFALIADVGKADFILIGCGGEFGVIDAGFKTSKDKIDSVMEEYGVSRLSFAVATHNDKDHIGSMEHVIEKYNVKTLYISPLEDEGKLYRKMIDAAAIKGTSVVEVKKGMTFNMGDAKFTVLSPDNALIEKEDVNEASAVIRMQYGDRSVLFMGDAQLQAEGSLMKNYTDELICDAIKIGHHGSSQASSQLFLSKTKAKYALISTGDEEPAADVTVKAINACKMTLLNTDTDGDLIIKTDGKTLTASPKEK